MNHPLVYHAHQATESEISTAASMRHLEKMPSMILSPKHIGMVSDNDVIPIKYNTIEIRLSAKKKQMNLIHTLKFKIIQIQIQY